MSPFCRRCGAALLFLSLFFASPSPAQAPVPLTREGTRLAALRLAPRLLLARSDTALAEAAFRNARLFPDPTLGASWSRSAPTSHVSLDIPLDLPWLRSSRIAAATFGRTGSRWRLATEEAATTLEADVGYTRALAAREQWLLSRRNGQDADSLHRIAVVRRDAGDASELDVQVALIFAGQQRRLAAADSLAYDDSRLALQATIGMRETTIVIEPSDSLTPPSAELASTEGTPLRVAAAEAELSAAAANASFARRNWIGAPSLMAGFERGDPGQPGMLPTVGLSLPLPLLNRNRGAVAIADAERQRAEALLAAARLEAATDLGRARRLLHGALEQVARDAALRAAADRVTAMARSAYREGAATLASVLEAQRNARDVRAQYLDDTASALVAAATLRSLTLRAETGHQP